MNHSDAPRKQTVSAGDETVALPEVGPIVHETDSSRDGSASSPGTSFAGNGTDSGRNGGASPASVRDSRSSEGEAARNETGGRRGFRLLPPNCYLGWTPYVWLVYVAWFVADPVLRAIQGRGSIGLWIATVLGLAIFLLTYFRGYWENGRRLLAIVAIQAALGAVYAPFNEASFVFFVYAASFAGTLDPPRVAIRTIALVTVAAGVTVWLADAPLYSAIGTIFAPLMGGVNLHFTQARNADGQLRLAQEGIRHLAVIAERERIGRDLHDVLGHTLSLIVLKSELAAKLLARDPDRAAIEIRDVECVSREALREVRETIGGYRASLDDELSRARSLLAAAGVRARFEAMPDTDVCAPRPEAVLALVLREAVTNVVRHAEATACSVRLAASNGLMLLEVADDGRGLKGPHGNGLRGMRERVASLSGTVEIGRATRRGGTRVRVTVPNGRPELAPAAGSTGA